jgi:hypothetical protein
MLASATPAEMSLLAAKCQIISTGPLSCDRHSNGFSGLISNADVCFVEVKVAAPLSVCKVFFPPERKVVNTADALPLLQQTVHQLTAY